MRYWNYIHMLGRVDDDIKIFQVDTVAGEKSVCNVRVVQEDRRGNLIVYVMIGWGQVATAMEENLFRYCYAIFSGKVITGKKGIDGIQVICNEFTVVEDARNQRRPYNGGGKEIEEVEAEAQGNRNKRDVASPRQAKSERIIF